MIRRTSDGFFVMSYKANYEYDGEEVEIHLDDKDEFEEQLKERIAIEEDKDIEDVELPDITYEEVELTEEQQARFDEIKEVEGISLDEVRDYTKDGTTSDSIAFKTFIQEKDLDDLWESHLKEAGVIE